MSVDVTILLADAANLDDAGRVNALGLGWEIIGPPPLSGFTVIVKLTASEERRGERFTIRLQLLDSTGTPVVWGQKDPAEPLDVQFNVEVSRASTVPAGMKEGAAVILEMGPGLLLEPGIHEWVASVDGETKPHWRQPFYVRAKPDEFPRGSPKLPAPGPNP